MALIERFRGFNVASALATRATSDPGRDFLRTRGGTVSYGQVDSQSDALAAALSHLGVEAGAPRSWIRMHSESCSRPARTGSS